MPEATAPKETLEFRAELKQLLHLITHSLYSNREIFLRELISNASDAINKIRFDSLTHEGKLEGNKDWKIRVVPDREAGTLTVSDNGVGMSRERAVTDLGTIAHSGTRAFLESLKEARDANRPELIGQFGVGFYSAFMVADKVTVVSREAGDPKAGVRWESDGQGSFTVEPAEKPDRGTDVVLHLKDDAREFLDEWTLRGVIKKFSDFIEHPIVLVSEHTDKDGRKEKVEEVVNTQKAVWLRGRSEVKPEEYAEFYKQISHDTEEPAKVIHYTAEGAQTFKALMFVPAHRPLWYHWEEPKPGLKLYVQRVLIMDPCEELLPPYLRFVRGVLDSADLPLNISREILQHTRLLESMRKNLVRSVLQGLEELKKNEPDKYARFFRDLGSMLKEGVARDPANRDKLAELLLFESVKTLAGQLVSLAQYAEAMPEGQSEIFYLVGDSREVLEHSPHLESFRAKGWDVLLLTDPLIDEFFTPALPEYKGKKLRAIDRGEFTPPEGERAAEGRERFEALLKFLKEKLPEVRDVRLSGRLTESAACLVGEAGGLPPHLERFLNRMGQPADPEATKRVLELNPDHPAVRAVRDLHEKNPQDARLEDYARLLYEQAVIAEGSKVKDPAAFARRVNALLAKDAAG